MFFLKLYAGCKPLVRYVWPVLSSALWFASILFIVILVRVLNFNVVS